MQPKSWSRLPDIGFVLFLCLCVIAATVALRYHGNRLERQALEAQQQVAELEAQHFSDHLAQTLNNVDLTLQSLAESSYHERPGGDWTPTLRRALRHSPHLRSISVLDTAGRVIASSNEANLGLRPDMADYLPHAAPPGETLRIGRAYAGRDLADGIAIDDRSTLAPGLEFVPVMRALTAADGSALRLIAVLNVDYFLNRMSERFAAERSLVDVLRYDGVVLFSTLEQPHGAALQAADRGIAARWQAGSESERVEEDIPGRGRLISAHRLDRVLPIGVVTRFDRAAAVAVAEAESRRQRLLLLPLVVLVLVIVLAAYLMMRRTGRRHAAAQESEIERFGTLLDALPASVLLFGNDGRSLITNRAWREGGHPGAGDAATDLDRFTVRLRTAEEDADDPGEGIRAVLRGERAAFDGEFAAEARGGTRWYQLMARPFNSTALRGVAVLALDVSRRREAEEKLRLDSRVFEVSAEAIIITNADNRIVSVNPAFTRITGYALHEVVGRDPSLLSSGQHPRAFYEEMWGELTAAGFWQGEIVNRRRSGECYPEWLTISADRDARGRVCHFVAVFSDISAMKAAQQALLESEERYRLTFAAVRDGMWDWNMVDDSVRWDARSFELLGYAPDAFPVDVGVFRQLAHPEDYEHVQETMQQQIARDESFAIELRLRTADGGWRWIESRGKVVERDGARPLRAVGTHTDIHARRTAEEQARLLGAALDAAANAVVITDTEAVIEWVNPAFSTLTGFTADEAVGRKPKELVKSGFQSREFYEALWTTILGSHVWRGELINRRKDGGFYHEALTITPVPDERNVLRHFVAVKEDITERKRVDAGLAATRARLAAVIANFQGAVLVEDQVGRVVLANERLRQTFALQDETEALGGVEARALMRKVSALGTVPPLFLRRIDELRAEGRPVFGEEIALQDGRVLERDFVPIVDAAGFLGNLWIHRDITLRKAHERELLGLATTDPLTGVRNRRAFMEQTELELLRVQRYERPAALLMVDLDHFKAVNDHHGHAAGDAVLCHFARLAEACLRATDLFGRLGGEEFAVLLPDTDGPGASELAERLRRQVAASTIEASGRRIGITVSIGVAVFGAEDSTDTVLARADAALYRAKSDGRNRVVFPS